MSTTQSSQGVASATVAGTSATVLEYLCLFTHDLRRKQKRWQDGRLKYHTFNKRVMVYDDRGNFIGDMHWRADWDFDAGEEINLERGGVIVQVSDCVGQQSQDLSQLLDKRVQEREQRVREKEQRRVSAASSRLSVPARRPESGSQPEQAGSNTPQIRHRPLTALIGTPSGHHGRAVVPSDSPFEQRKKAGDTSTNEDAPRPLKRRRTEDTPPSKLGYAQSLFGTTLTLSGAPPSSARLSVQPFTSQTTQQAVLPPSPEAENHDMPVSPSSRRSGNATRRSPLRVINDRRTNSALETTTPRLSKEARDQVSVPPRMAKNRQLTRDSGPKQTPKQASRPEDIVDLTRSSDPSGLSAHITPKRAVPADSPGNLSPPGLLPDKDIGPNRTVTSTKSLRAAPGIDIELDHAGACQETNPLGKDARRTELRLRSRKKRGLLVLSEQANTIPTKDITKEALPTEMRSSFHDHNFRPEPAVLRADAKSSDTSLSLGTTSGSLNESFSDQGQSLVRSSRKSNRDASQTHHVADGEAKLEEKLDGLGDRAEISVGKSRKDTTRGEVVCAADLVDQPVGEPRREPGTKRRLKRKPAQHHAPAFAETGEPAMEQHDAAEDKAPLLNAPRLVKLSRKSIRSKELIGFVFEDTKTPRGNAIVSANTSVQTRANSPEACPARLVPVSLATHEHTTVTGTGTESASFADYVAEGDFFRQRSPSPFHQPEPTTVKGTKRCAQDAVNDKLANCPVPTETSDREVGQPPPDNLSMPPPARLPQETQVTLDPSISECRGQETALKATTIKNDGQFRVVREEPPKLANPATRGRKAALKSHAAGQVPQPILPPDMGVQAAQTAQRGQIRSTGAATTASGISNAPPRIQMTFPGFVSAKGGGPWSREAHDLLEAGRPSLGPRGL